MTPPLGSLGDEEKALPGRSKAGFWIGGFLLLVLMGTCMTMVTETPKKPAGLGVPSASDQSTVTDLQARNVIRKFEVFQGSEGADVVLAPGFYALEYDGRMTVMAQLSEAAAHITGSGYLRLLDPYTNKKIGFYLDGHLDLSD